MLALLTLYSSVEIPCLGLSRRARGRRALTCLLRRPCPCCRHTASSSRLGPGRGSHKKLVFFATACNSRHRDQSLPDPIARAALGLQRSGRRRATRHVEHRRGQRSPIAVEDVRAGGEAERSDETLLLVEDRRRDAAEVLLELLPVHDAGGG